jgi:hypothetical protein
MSLETWEWIVVGVGAALLLLVVLGLIRIRRRRAHLQERFGPEYYRTVSDAGTRGAERQLSDVERDHDELDLRQLPTATRDRYVAEWRSAEARFVTDPRDATRAASWILERMLEERGYPSDTDEERRVALVAVDHPQVAERYRHGNAMLDLVDGPASTENLRKAMVDLRAVFEELVQAEPAASEDRTLVESGTRS